MRISHPIRVGIAWAVIASGSLPFAISAGASTSAVACLVTRWDPHGARTSVPPVTSGASEQLQVTGPLITLESGVLWVSPDSVRPPVATGASEQLQVPVAPLVFVTVEFGILWVYTNTGRPPATTDRFYL